MRLASAHPASGADQTFFVTTALGLEEVLAEELRAIIGGPVAITRSGVSFVGTLEQGYRVCLWSRIASRVLLRLSQFPAPNPDQLYAGVRRIHWTEHLTPAQTLAVHLTTSQSQITHSHYGALKAKDAIVDQFRAVVGTRPSVDPIHPDLRINIHLHRDLATVSLDLSGESLHKRGYRVEAAEAPLKENLAAAILSLAGWPAKFNAFVDPMCGSGTLPLEAARMAARIAPGRNRRKFGFMGWQGYVPRLWQRLLEEAQALEVRDLRKLPRIVGYDANPRVIRMGLEQLQEAGVHARVHLEKRVLAQATKIADAGLILVNPPYGVRLGEVDSLKGLYRQLGSVLKNQFSNWEAGVLTGSRELAQEIGLKPDRRFVVYNGAIECRFLKYTLYSGIADPRTPKELAVAGVPVI